MEGDLIENIQKSVAEDKIDFVVMGTAGVTDWDDVLLGSNSDDVIGIVCCVCLSQIQPD
jgi:nucleotide-binding universal stress UspA family protein